MPGHSQPTATPAALRAALLEASLALAGMLARSRVQAGRDRARQALTGARAVLAQPDAPADVPPVPETTNAGSADELVAGWIASGGAWRELAAAVNRQALAGSTAHRNRGASHDRHH